MPIEYRPLPEFQFPNVNLLGAYAQGEASATNELRRRVMEQQLAEAARQQQAEEEFRQYAGQPGFNPLAQETINRAFVLNPTLGRQMLQSATQAASERALEAQRRGSLSLQQQELGLRTPLIQAQTGAEQALEAQRRGQGAREEREFAFKEKKFGLEERELAARIGKEEASRIVEEAKAAEAHINKTYDLAAKADNQNKWMAARAYGLAKAQPEDRAIMEAMWPEDYSEENKSSLLSTAEQARQNYAQNFIKAKEFEYRQVQEPSGKTRVVAIPKYAPEKGAVTVPGTEGAEAPNYNFLAGPPDTGLVTRTNPRTGQAELITPTQPVMRPAEGKFDTRANVGGEAAPAAEGALIPSEIRPTAEAPVGSAAYNNKRFATEALDAVGFNSRTGEDKITDLIKKSTSGGLDVAGAGLRGFFGKATPGMEAIGQIKPIVKDIILKKMNGKLGAGISNEDRAFIESTVGNLDDPSIPANQRLASWNSAKQILMKYANTGQPVTGAPGNRPSLNEIFK